jgi:chemotaxis protein methyltransferase WspC
VIELSHFEALLKHSMGLDSFSIGSATVERAVRERMSHAGSGDIEDYWQRLSHSSEELQHLIESVVVPETWFFRDREAFSALVTFVVEEWWPSHSRDVLRLLSIPCSTGEEPYSMLMALLSGGVPLHQLHLDAVDISTQALDRAQRGVYGANSFRGEDLRFRDLNFEETVGSFVLAGRLREHVHFRRANLLAEDFTPQGPPYDVIFCRNLLIYFDRSAQERAMRTLGSWLKDSGLLFVGPAEAFLASCNGFTSFNRAMSFAFRKTRKKLFVPVSAPSSGTAKPLRRCSRQRTAPVGGTARPKIPPPAAQVPVSADLETARRLADSGSMEQAAQVCEQYLELRGPSAEAYYLLGLIRDSLRDRPAAANFYRKAVYLEPGHAEALIHLALFSESEGDPAAAQRLRERARRAEQSAIESTHL